MFGLYESAIILTRVLLEEVLRKRGKSKIASISPDKTKGYLQNLIDYSPLPKELKDEAHKKIRLKANEILHKAKIEGHSSVKIDIITETGESDFGVTCKLDFEQKEEALLAIRVVVAVIEFCMSLQEK